MNGLQAYQRVNTQTSITDADPHKLIQLLYNGALERINMAKAKIQQKDYGAKAQLINKAIEIVGGLRSFLDFEKGGELALRLEASMTTWSVPCWKPARRTTSPNWTKWPTCCVP